MRIDTPGNSSWTWTSLVKKSLSACLFVIFPAAKSFSTMMSTRTSHSSRTRANSSGSTENINHLSLNWEFKRIFYFSSTNWGKISHIAHQLVRVYVESYTYVHTLKRKWCLEWQFLCKNHPKDQRNGDSWTLTLLRCMNFLVQDCFPQHAKHKSVTSWNTCYTLMHEKNIHLIGYIYGGMHTDSCQDSFLHCILSVM